MILKPASIFIVTHDSPRAEDLRDRLQRLGYRVAGMASRGEDAIEQMAPMPPDVALVDIRLAGKFDGPETVRRLGETRQIAIVFLATEADSALDERVGETESCGYLLEPFGDRDLRATIQMALYRGKMERSLREANERLEEKVSERTAELLEANRRLQDLFDNAHDLIQAVAPDGTFLFVNRAWCQALGYTEAESVGLNMFDIIAPDYRKHCAKVFQRLIQGEDVGLIDVALIAKNGQRVELEGTSSTRFVQGAPVSTRSIFRDVTVRRQTESALLRSQRLLKTVTDIVPGMVGYWTTDLTCAFANPSYLKWFGRTPEEMRGIRLQDLLGPRHFKQNEPYIRGVLAGKAQQFERRLKQA